MNYKTKSLLVKSAGTKSYTCNITNYYVPFPSLQIASPWELQSYR